MQPNVRPQFDHELVARCVALWVRTNTAILGRRRPPSAAKERAHFGTTVDDILERAGVTFTKHRALYLAYEREIRRQAIDTITPPKTCGECGETFSREGGERIQYWASRQWCRACNREKPCYRKGCDVTIRRGDKEMRSSWERRKYCGPGCASSCEELCAQRSAAARKSRAA